MIWKLQITLFQQKDEKFEFPDLFPDNKNKEQQDEYEKSLQLSKQSFDEYKEKNKNRQSLPGWFTV